MTRPPVRRRALSLRAALVAPLAAVVLAGCGASGSDDEAADPTSGSPSAAAETTTAPQPTSPDEPPEEPTALPAEVDVAEALQFEATTVTGDAFVGASVAGRPVVLWFWAPWCAVCKSQAPEVSSLSETYGDDVAFVGVGALSDSESIKTFADDVPGLTHLSDPEGDLYQRFGISEQSSFVVLDADGQEVLRTGYADDDDLADTVAGLAG